MTQTERKDEVHPTIRTALAAVVGTHLGAFGLALTYVLSVAFGSSAPTALMRAVPVWVVLTLAGRGLGALAGDFLGEERPPSPPAPGEVEVIT